MIYSLPSRLLKKHTFYLFLAAFAVRGLTFYYFIEPYYRYNQPDTKDYHWCTISLAQGRGMSYCKSDRPIFWRTPGYPLLLLPFYKYFGLNEVDLKNYRSAHRTFLWLQIILCSFLPIIIFLLATLLTGNALIAWSSALLSIVHLGFVLSSTYLMTDALSTLLFLLFVYFLFKALFLPTTQFVNNLIFAGLSLSFLTWMRPMGLYLAALAILLMVISSTSTQQKYKGIFLFSLMCFGSLSPWFIRNYRLTGSVFFCPLWGPYVLTFLVPKIYQRLHGGSLVPSIKRFQHQAYTRFQKETLQKKLTQSPYVPSVELICSQIASPWIWNYPGYFMLDWLIEIIKTTCDLYSSHLVNFAKNNFDIEPPIEFLSDKLRDCLYRQKIPLSMRIITLIEALMHILMLLGLLGGSVFFIMLPLTQWSTITNEERARLKLWIHTGIFIAMVIGMTGGFGYARLRLPVEALMIILALDFWFWLAGKLGIGFLQHRSIEVN